MAQDKTRKKRISEPSEGIFQRAIKSAGAAVQAGLQNMNHLGVQVNPKFPFLPTMPIDSHMLSAGMEEAQMPITKGNTYAQGAMSLGSGLLSGAMLGGGQAAKGVGKVVKSLMKPSKVFGESVSKGKGKVDFLKIISKHADDPAVKKVLDKSGVIEKYGGTSLGKGGSVTEKLKS